MARDHARVNLAIWADPDWRQLPPAAQHLYLTLWTSPGLTYAGTHDWRPARLTGLTRGWTRDHVETVADCLQARHFFVIDHDTEEVFIRSWMRFDELLKQPRMAISCITAYAAVASEKIRRAIVFELVKERKRLPDLACWGDDRVAEVLTHPAVSAKDYPTPTDPFGGDFGGNFGHGFALGLPQTQGDVSPSVSTPPTPAPAPATHSSPPRQSPLTPRKHAATLLGWDEEDERLDHLDKLLADRKVRSKKAWLDTVHANGELADLLADAARPADDGWSHLPWVQPPGGEPA